MELTVGGVKQSRKGEDRKAGRRQQLRPGHAQQAGCPGGLGPRLPHTATLGDPRTSPLPSQSPFLLRARQAIGLEAVAFRASALSMPLCLQHGVQSRRVNEGK